MFDINIFILKKRLTIFFLFILAIMQNGYGQDFYKVVNLKPISIWKPDINPHRTNSTSDINKLIRKAARIQWQYPDSALAILKQATYESIIVGDFEQTALAQSNMGLAAMSKGDLKSSFMYYHESMKYIQISGTEKKILPTLYINIGATYFYQDNYQKAFEYYYAILQFMIKETPNDPNLVMAHNNIADVLIHMGQYDRALYYLDQGESLLKKNNAEDMHSYLVANKADIALKLQHYEIAKKYIDEALALAIKYKNREAEQSINILMANYLLIKNRPKEAIAFLNKALETNTTIYPFLSFIAPYYTLGFAYYQAGDYAHSEKVLLTALKMADKLKVNADRVNALNTLSNIYEKTGRYKEALVERNAYNLLKDSIQEMEKRTLGNELEVKFRTAQKDKKIAQTDLLVEKQERDLDNKNVLLLSIVSGAALLLVIGVILYLNIKNKNRIVALHAKLEGEELERTRIAAELHDGIGGMLAVVKMRLTSGNNEVNHDNDVVDLLNETSAQIRNTAHNLMPNVINDFTLKEALTQYVENINHGQKKLKIDLQIHSELQLTKASSKLSIYRMLQEVIQNIIKHAKASEANIQIFEQPGRLHFLIEDNGVGFNFDKVKKGLGLTNLETRVKLMNGNLQIDAAVGKGTTINIEVAL